MELFKAFPYSYHLRSLLTRRASTLLNLVALMVTVLVYVVMNGMALGMREALESTGRENVLIVLAKGEQSAEVSRLSPEFFPILRYYPEIAKKPDGSPLFSEEVYAVKPLRHRTKDALRWIQLRGIDPPNLTLYEGVVKIEGRPVQKPQEVVVGKMVPLKMGPIQLGDQIELGKQTHTVVGFLSAGGSAYESELWVSRADLKLDFDIKFDSMGVVYFNNLKDRDSFTERVLKDPRLRLEVKSEKQYFADATKNASVLEWITNLMAFILSLVAIFTGMNSLYASIAARTKEIGTLRAMGYGRRTIQLGLLMEGMILSGLAGLVTLLFALPFDELAVPFIRTSFRIQLSAGLMAKGVFVAVLVGFLGSLLPARQAAKMKIVEALK